MKKTLLFVLATLVLLAAILIANTLFWRSKQIQISPSSQILPVQGFVQRISTAIQHQTISYDDRPSDTLVFKKFEMFLKESYPSVHTHLKKEVIGTSSLVFLWEGSDKHLPALMLLAHQDVVPAEPSKWKFNPFAGVYDSSFVYGRGCLDDKGSLLGILEATELLLAKGFKPRRSIYLAFGHDEEIGGTSGAKLIAQTFKERKIRLDFILDEGGVIITGAAPGISKPLAVVGIAEKGYMSLQITAHAEGGHTSMPPKDVAITRLSNAILKINANPFQADLTGAIQQLFAYAGPEMNFPMKLVFANQWLFQPIVKKILAESPSTNATIRTTTAFTILKAGTKENVLPTSASAILNLRILPGETSKDVMSKIENIINDPSITLEILPFFSEPSPVSDPNSKSFVTLNKTIRQVFQIAL